MYLVDFCCISFYVLGKIFLNSSSIRIHFFATFLTKVLKVRFHPILAVAKPVLVLPSGFSKLNSKFAKLDRRLGISAITFVVTKNVIAESKGDHREIMTKCSPFSPL